MSTFSGFIDEIPDISVDRFTGNNFNSCVFFLSHCHQDHMDGLNDWEFQKHLNEKPDVYLYTSPISCNILRNKYPNILSKVIELPIDTPTLITFPNNTNRMLSVTVIPAGHCPGSVMFLFEDEKNILYTGDYRVQLSDLKKIKAFYCMGQVKQIHKIYLDTTFFSQSYKTLPTRQDTSQVICEAIKDFISQSEKNTVQLVTSATYGSEFLFSEIARNIGCPIHLQATTYNVLKDVPELDEYITLNGLKTQIHSSCGPTFRDICSNPNKSNLLIIKPSVLWWKDWDFNNGISSTERNGTLRVCYSCHASFQEIRDLILFLKPLEIEPCVLPRTEKETDQLYNDISEIMDSYLKVTKTGEMHHTSDEIEVKYIAQSVSFQNEVDVSLDILNSPPRDFKRKRMWLGNTSDIE